MSKVGGSWKCSVCDYESKLKARTFEHVEAKHVKSQGYNCSICQKFCSTYNALKLHKFSEVPVQPPLEADVFSLGSFERIFVFTLA